MKKYKIEVWEEMSGFIETEAKTEKEAIKKIQCKLSDYGISNLVETDLIHRDTKVFSIKQIK